MVNLDSELRFKEIDKSMSEQSRYNSVLTAKNNQGVAVLVLFRGIPGVRCPLCICRGTCDS